MKILFSLTLIVLVLDYNEADITYLNGESGVSCGEHRCLKDQAECVDQKCVCFSGHGNGNFACYNSSNDEVYAEIKNDPIIVTFAHERVAAHMPCRALFTHLHSYFQGTDGTQHIGSCEIKVFTFAFKIRGKFYLQGFDLLMSIILWETWQKKDISIRIEGSAKDGTFTFLESGKDNVDVASDWGPPEKVNAFGQKIRTYYDGDNNLAIIDVARCGLRIQFRPTDVDHGKDQTQIPGLSVALVQNNVAQWLSRNIVLALPPFHIGPTLGEISNQFNVAPSEAILARFLEGAADQNFPGAPSQCGHLITTASDCMVRESRKEALELCSSLLMLPKFVRCFTNKTLEHETDSVLELFGACLNALCHRITPECLLVQDRITSSHCVDDTVPELTGFNCQF
ncbi:hypothetical protein BgiMline_022043 [Biomphalaria glabrata]|uniref:Uncharacterized protein LOC106068130 n=1 Tax=Biomphalaria glabrata TaxID=6526 RepID=A0A9U8EDX4_BIOGL|nr:uncharacterized protein LOC106068130 [Biomphalaria glabrata]KAI8756421.1 hypothetical protein BgiMline_009936 [Biomphalaria glabrata]